VADVAGIAYDLVAGIGWEWQSEAWAVSQGSGNPTDREKKETKRSVVVESHGLPVGIVLDGANRHDIRLLP
jgi:putative transposase